MSVRIGTASHPKTLLETATEVLVADPSASLADVARAAGVGRTTLHKLYPTRHALLVALARDALDVLEDVYGRCGLDDPGPGVEDVLRRLAGAVVPLGPRMEFLLRERSLDAEPDLTARLDALDGRVLGLVQRARDAGALRADLPPEWIVATLNALVYAAWELTAAGRIAPVAAPGFVVDTLLRGTGAPS